MKIHKKQFNITKVIKVSTDTIKNQPKRTVTKQIQPA